MTPKPQMKQRTEEELLNEAAAGASDILVPLNRGRHCYVRHPVSKRNLHFSTTDPKLTETLRAICANSNVARKVTAELEDFSRRFSGDEYPEARWQELLDEVLATQDS